MQPLNHIRKPVAALVASAMLLAAVPVIAGDGERMGFTTYYFTDSGDNKVVTSSFTLVKRILRQTAILLDIELDNVTVPAVTAVTGATRPKRRMNEPFEKSRGQVILGIEQGLSSSSSMTASVYRSQEVDYISNAVVAGIQQELNSGSTTIAVRGQVNADKVGKLLENGDITNNNKSTYSGAATMTQLLSPTTVLDVTYDLVHLRGFQSDPYRQVRVYDQNNAFELVDELHPVTRWRHAGSGRLSQMLPEITGSVIGSYRYYFDNWKVRSHTAEIRFNKYIFSDLVFGVDYRYYTQSGAYFFKEKYAGQEYLDDAMRTADYKLKPFNSNNFGFTLTYLLRGLGGTDPDLEFLQNSAIEVMYFRYFNNLDFSADIVQASIKFSL
jgi:hypothetical protein